MFINGNKVYKDAECQHLAGYLFYANPANDDGHYLSYDKEGQDPVMPENLTEEMIMTGVYITEVGRSDTSRIIAHFTVENHQLSGSSERYTGPVLFALFGGLEGETLRETMTYDTIACNCAGKYLVG